ncbi:hypothetical protein PIB30_073660 [Stylosanthes scabra]|uniref:Uncharacterized protein n=1 Tax=Stylosanthes scabra TaxID=79078 RepID=A0ABU6WSU5_9FABA|nr:hypothetical protein [Stylosanthes scabra]
MPFPTALLAGHSIENDTLGFLWTFPPSQLDKNFPSTYLYEVYDVPLKKPDPITYFNSSLRSEYNVTNLAAGSRRTRRWNVAGSIFSLPGSRRNLDRCLRGPDQRPRSLTRSSSPTQLRPLSRV